MTPRTPLALAATFLLCLVATGLPYWSIPYARASLPDALVTYALVLVVVAPLALCATATASVRQATLAAGLGPPGAVLARIVAGVLQDPTSHNLWPFELVLGAAVGLPLALAGALAGKGLAALAGRR